MRNSTDNNSEMSPCHSRGDAHYLLFCPLFSPPASSGLCLFPKSVWTASELISAPGSILCPHPTEPQPKLSEVLQTILPIALPARESGDIVINSTGGEVGKVYHDIPQPKDGFVGFSFLPHMDRHMCNPMDKSAGQSHCRAQQASG